MNVISRYTHFIVYGEATILFHLPTDGIISLRPELANVVERYRHDIDALEPVHPELYARMKQMGMLVPEGEDEGKKTFERWEAVDSDPTHFSIIVNPTLDCNLRCWYCYEEHRHGATMTPDTLQALCRLVDRTVEQPELKTLSVSFFGGEPLLPFRKVVLPLLQHASARCAEKGIGLNTAFTTNAVALTPAVLDELERITWARIPSFQITLDGNEAAHDKVRFTADHKPTYATIVSHVRNVARRGWTVSLRFNYTHENVDTFLDVLHDLRDLTPEERRRVHCNFQQIWQDKHEHPEAEEKAREYVATFQEEGFPADCDGVVRRGNCYADATNCIVVNYDGNVFKCTAREFLPEHREGILHADGCLTFNERYHHRQAVKYANPACRDCVILPICNGGCTQAKVERERHDACYYNLTETDKTRRVVDRLKYVMSNLLNE